MFSIVRSEVEETIDMSITTVSAAALLAGAALATTAAATDLRRFATVPLKAEITGLYITKQGDLFFNTQHPSDANAAPFNRASIGFVRGVDFNNLPTEFDTLSVPKTDSDKQSVRVALGAFSIIGQEGDFAGQLKGGLGAIVAKNGSVILKSNRPDFNAFLPSNAEGTEGYLFTNWEDKPGGMSRLKITQDESGKWVTSAAEHVDFTSVNGTWLNCFGSVSPWGTPLTSEELYFDDTSDWNNANFKDHDEQLSLAKYLGRFPNPYDYGFIVEITDPKGAAKPVKHFALGRFSHENSVVMPDQKTVYLSDDGSSTVLFKFVADQAGDLSSGTLMAAKVKQQDSGNAADPAATRFNISWIQLAKGNNDTIEKWIREYDGKTPDEYKRGTTSYISDTDITDWAAGKSKDDRVAFLESRKAASAKGATAEFRKMEGIMINHEGAESGKVPFMYLAMSEIGKGMADGKGDIRLKANKCGVVYQMKLEADFNVKELVPVVAGGPYDKGAKPNQCATDGIANPDNLLVLNDGRVLIGEDTGKHENNVLWVWTPAKLS